MQATTQSIRLFVNRNYFLYGGRDRICLLSINTLKGIYKSQNTTSWFAGRIFAKTSSAHYHLIIFIGLFSVGILALASSCTPHVSKICD